MSMKNMYLVIIVKEKKKKDVRAYVSRCGKDLSSYYEIRYLDHVKKNKS